MTRPRHAAAVLLFLLVVLSPSRADNAPPAMQGTLQAAFSPWDDVESLLLDAIVSARKQVLVQAYLLTSRQITTRLVAAHRRGVDVQVMLDAEQQSRMPEAAAVLASAGVPVWLETRYQNAHNKIIVIDPAGLHPIVITGSFNFTWTAQHRNAENILIVRDNPDLADRYAMNWHRHWKDALPYMK